MIEEYGTDQQSHFTEGTLYDCNLNPVLCSCGKPSARGIFGKESFQVFCNDCSPLVAQLLSSKMNDKPLKEQNIEHKE